MFDKIKQRSFEEGRELGYKTGLEEGKNEGYSNGYQHGRVSGYQEAINELNEKYIQQNKNKTSIDSLTDSEYVDYVMLWLKAVAEIVNTKFFKNMLFSGCDSKGIKGYLDFIDSAEGSSELKTYYQETYYYMPELKKALKQVYSNKLATEEAEKLL